MDDGKDTLPTHAPGTRKGEEIKEQDGQETGRHDKGTSHADREAGGRSARSGADCQVVETCGTPLKDFLMV